MKKVFRFSSVSFVEAKDGAGGHSAAAKNKNKTFYRIVSREGHLLLWYLSPTYLCRNKSVYTWVLCPSRDFSEANEAQTFDFVLRQTIRLAGENSLVVLGNFTNTERCVQTTQKRKLQSVDGGLPSPTPTPKLSKETDGPTDYSSSQIMYYRL
ncbi:hypothetical protein BDB00DRAFT_784574 [Zychaea mexicana]|uniref:uncharacterized protein n=1 Tax=Zychaea mexicana TaxID=64656 RepID=UPI0022FDD043|nr:uncharacterized protein BDB00DRAFT_784574 [Zychaea mexicana]KAI9497647.1 hypothetical protein BDB00DRAFT_784574 [Zychaea mexicana]